MATALKKRFLQSSDRRASLARKLEVTGLVADKRGWSLAALRTLPQQDQVTRHICVEGWSAIGKWGGVPFGQFLKRITALYVTNTNPGGYWEDQGYNWFGGS